MSNGINYVAANEGGLTFGIETTNGTINRRADTIQDGVELIKKYGIAEAVFGSSSMDFAAEEVVRLLRPDSTARINDAPIEAGQIAFLVRRRKDAAH